KVTNMEPMFDWAEIFNQDLSSWDVASVTNMTKMFAHAESFNQDLSTWCVSQFSSKPSDFDMGTLAWTLPKPNWGTCTPPFDPDNFILTVDTTKGTGLDMELPLM